MDSQMPACLPAFLLVQAFMIISGAPALGMYAGICGCGSASALAGVCKCVYTRVPAGGGHASEVRVLKVSEQHSPSAPERTVWQPKSHWGKLNEVHFR